MSINLPQARALVEAATPGEWTVDDGHPDDYIGIAYASDDDRGHVATIVEYRSPQGLRDARFIAASRQLVPELLAEVERLTRERDSYANSNFEGQLTEARADLESARAEVESLRPVMAAAVQWRNEAIGERTSYDLRLEAALDHALTTASKECK